MTKLKDVAYVLRSKNAGPFYLTIDIIFNDSEIYESVLKSEIISNRKVASLYKCNPNDVEIHPYKQAQSIKVSFPRNAISGDMNDTDLFGAQHHVPLMEETINTDANPAAKKIRDGRKAWNQVNTTSVSDALNGLTNLHNSIKPISDHLKVVGPAYPVSVNAADNLLVLRGIAEANPGDVLVIDAKGYQQNASCGDFVIGLAKTMGLAGVVVDGVVRDIKGIHEMDYPVFSRGTTVAASGKHGTGKTGEPISCGGISVHRGDLILGDIDGVTVIPKEKENEVLVKALEKEEKDTQREENILGNKEAALSYIQEQLEKAGR
ncbi:DUF4387 family protein [Virgibacillus oceani]